MTRDERRAFWQQHVEAWQASGESQAAYCRRMNLSPMTFSQWKRRFERDQLLASVADTGGRSPLVEVQVSDAAQPAASGVSLACAGVQLHLAPGFDAATLQRAVAALTDAGR
jgi:transposase-like protein